jgi:hypothetical protein
VTEDGRGHPADYAKPKKCDLNGCDRPVDNRRLHTTEFDRAYHAVVLAREELRFHQTSVERWTERLAQLEANLQAALHLHNGREQER